MKKIIGLVLVVGIIACLYFFTSAPTVEAAVVSEYTGFDVSNNDLDSYELYKKDITSRYTGEDIIINAINSPIFENGLYNDDISEIDIIDDEITTKALLIPETGQVSWNVDINENGYYNIKIKYYTVEGRSSEITRGIMINNEYPFREAESFVLPRIWQDEFDVDKTHKKGKHDTKPLQIEKLRWAESDIRDTAGYYDGEAYKFYLTAGTKKITLVADREPVVISTITLYGKNEVKNYSEVETEYETLGLEKKANKQIVDTVQGESSYEKSSPILSPVANWSSYKVEPYVKYMTRYNTIGGTTWRVAGDAISWNLKVPEDGLYKITIKVLQNYNRGLYSTRRLYLNGEVPFKECENLTFKYSSDWQNVTLGNENGDYWFYLKANQKNILTLEATIGEYDDVVLKAKELITRLNYLYRNVVMIAGANPNKYADYFLNKRIKNYTETINESINDLEYCIDKIIDIAGERSSLVSSFERTLYQLKEFSKSEKKVQVGLNELDDNIAALGTWVMTVSEQSLSIDKIIVHGEKAKIKKATTNFFQKIWHELIMLLGSYGANTSLESSAKVDGPTITVWITSGRDQSQLLRQLIDGSFTIQKGINVKLKLVTSSVLLPATLTHNGPDVIIGVGQNIPVNWGIRNALVDLKGTFKEDYDNFVTNFHSSALTPFTFNGATYALPDTQDFLVSFVRNDIIEDLNSQLKTPISIPTTWNEVIDVLPVLQRKYLEYYIPNSKASLSTVLYAMMAQNGGSLYNDNGSKTLVAEEESQKAFIDFSTFFSDRGFVISANFSNRFRSGEMPMGIANFSLYNTLSVFAPEIRGQWSFAYLPGYEDSPNAGTDGFSTKVYQTTSVSTGTVILQDSKNKAASWEFVKWWLGAQAQEDYAKGMEAILGAAARYPTANLEAFKKLPWSTRDYRILTAQRNMAVGIPTVPGDYIVGRYIDNAFRAIINNNINPSESLYDYAQKINLELTRKRKEFNLD